MSVISVATPFNLVAKSKIMVRRAGSGREILRILDPDPPDLRSKLGLLTSRPQCSHGRSTHVTLILQEDLSRLCLQPELRQIYLVSSMELLSESLLISFPANEFLHQVDVLQHLTSRSTPESKQIAAHLQKAFESISTLVPMVPKSGFQKQSIGQSHEGSNNVEIAAETSNAFPKMAARLLPVLLQAMDHMSQANQDQALEGSIVYKFVETYNTILHQVCSLAVHATLSCTAISAQSTLVSTRERQRAEGETNNPATISSTPHAEALLSLCDLAVAMTTALEPAKPAQARMLEGCLLHLITKIGSGLRTSIFGSSSNSNNDNNNNDNNAPSDPTQDLEGRLTAEADRQLEAQAPHLIYILARTPTHLPIISAHSSLPTQVETPSSVLLRLAKRKLQNTLLNAVFPAHALGLMKQTLKPPEEPPAAPLQSESSDGAVAEMEVEVREWYKSEVFRLVGWDALDEYLRVSVW